MFTIEEESGTYSGTRRRHDGYYAGDFSRAPMPTPGELAALTRLLVDAPGAQPRR